MEIDRELPFSPSVALEHIIPFPPFPTKLLLNIFDLACSSPKTALTLCLASKHFNALARSFLFRSISVCGSEETQGLVDFLEKNPLIPPMVRHLFLSQCAPRDRDDPDSDKLLVLSHTSQRIITLLAPFLEMLSYIFPSITDRAHFPHVFATPLPRPHEFKILEGAQHPQHLRHPR